MAPLEDGQTIDDDKRQLSNLKLEASGNQWIFVYIQLIARLTRWMNCSQVPAHDASSSADGIRHASAERSTGLRRDLHDKSGTATGAPPPHGMVFYRTGSQFQVDRSCRWQVSTTSSLINRIVLLMCWCIWLFHISGRSMFRTWTLWECGCCPTTPILATKGASFYNIFLKLFNLILWLL